MLCTQASFVLSPFSGFVMKVVSDENGFDENVSDEMTSGPCLGWLSLQHLPVSSPELMFNAGE